MLDIRLLAQDPETFAARLARRGKGIDLEPVFALDRRRRELIQRSDELRHRKGKAEEAMKTADKKGPDFAAFRDEMRTVANEIKVLEESLKVVEVDINEAIDKHVTPNNDLFKDRKPALYKALLRKND